MSTLLTCITSINYAQNLEQIGKAKLVTVTGGVSANSVFYEGTANRAPFSYFLTGSINLNISGVYNLPFTFSYTNQKFKSSNPFNFNRLSLHPSYKWVTAHIGDVSMTFSPYTLSGHQFTGIGADLSPEGPLKFSAMYGRLLKESEYNLEDPQSEPSYKRMGYGFKTTYTTKKFEASVILFKGKDEESSIENPVPLEFELQPKENVVGSVETSVELFEKGSIAVEYATSVITEDLNIGGEANKAGFLSLFLNTNASTQSYKAYNANFSYQVGQGTIGVGYEYIDPEYRTFGAYFFNNDLENITINASQTIFEGKVSIAVNGGLQRDDLENKNSSQLQRIVSAVNLTYTPNEKLNLAGGYSNFQSYTNIKNQFDYINEVSQSDNLDTLNFQQISHNATFNVNYVLKDTETKSQNLNMDFSYNGAASMQGGEPAENGDSNFYNGSTAYTIGYLEKDLSVSGAFNASYNAIGVDKSLIFGPSISASKQFLEKKIRTTASASYNQSRNNGEKAGEVTNFRLGGNYSLKKKHNFSLNLLSQLRRSTTATQDFTATLGYNYVFDKINPRINLPKRKKKENPLDDVVIQFKYHDSVFGDTQGEINRQLAVLQSDLHFKNIPQYKKQELTTMRESLSKLNDAAEYEIKAIEFLEELYSYDEFLKGYNALVYGILTELQRDMQRLDHTFENGFVRAKNSVNNHSLHKKTDAQRFDAAPALQKSYRERVKRSNDAQARLIAHRWMLPIIASYTTMESIEKPDELLGAVMQNEKDAIYKMQNEGKAAPDIELYLIAKIIDFYWIESLKHTNPDDFELKYMQY